MADTTRDNRKEETEKNPKKFRKLKGFLAFFLTLVIVLGLVLFAAYRDGTGMDVLRRYFHYGRSEKVGGVTEYLYDASAQNHFAVLGDQLVVLSDISLRVLNRDGTEVWSTAVKMKAPALVQGGDRVVAYDVGGTELHVLNQEGELLRLTANEEEPFISASLNEKGWLAVTARKENYKGCVSVYDESLELVFAFNSARRFVEDAYITDDCKYLAAVTLGQENSVFVSNVVLYDLTKTEPVANYDITDGLVAEICEKGGSLVTVSDTCLTVADTKGEILGSYAYGDDYLREFEMAGDGFTVLLLNRYQSGSVGRLVTIGPEGEELGTLDIRKEVLSVSACGRYIAVLYPGSLVVYNQNLNVYATLNGITDIKEALVRADGSALLMSSQSASLFLP